MTEMSPAEWFDQPVRITPDSIYFGDAKLPGLIAEGGVTFKPGISTECNTLTVTFLVGSTIQADDVYSQDIITPAETVTQYSSRPTANDPRSPEFDGPIARQQ